MSQQQPPPLISSPKRTFEDDYSNNLNQQLAQEQQQQPDMFDQGVSRRSRAKNFKNPPQPHLCIKEKTTEGQELFINVMSWTRIVDPNDANSPIPLFGGMRVQPSSPRTQCTSLIYAVMASPEVLKKVGRKQQTPELLNLVDLMCEFVEAMNPGLHLSRKPEVLKDRDLSGELKDVWNAVQSMREKQKYEGHNMNSENLVVYTEFGPPPLSADQSAPNYEQSIMHLKQQQQQQQQQEMADSQSAINNKNNSILSDLNVSDSEVDKKQMDDLCRDTANLKLQPTEGGADEADSNKLIENLLKPTETGGDKDKVKDNRDLSPVAQKTPTHTPLPLSCQSQASPITTTPSSPNNNSSSTNNSSNNQHHKKEKDSNVTSSHPFQFMFRSSKNHHHHNNDDEKQDSKKKEVVGNDKADKEKDNKEHHHQEQEPTKNNIKKGLSFFRRNKSSSPAPVATTPPIVTPPPPAKTEVLVAHEKTIEQFDENNSSTTPNNKKIELEAATVYAK